MVRAGAAGVTRLLPPLKDRQAEASAPDRHVWLSASAGTGKTQVLAARVYRLLLRGTEPGAILCLTFTKAGAAEMAARVNGRLAAWVRMGEADLRRDLFALGEDPNDAALVARARTLFARVLDAPGGGIRIQTIHGFCQGLLAGFPLEAGLVPGFRPLEAREEAQLAREALAGLLVQAEREGRERPVATVGALSRRLGEGGAERFLLDCARAPDALAALPAGLHPFLRRALDLPAEDVDAHVRAACADGAFDVAGLRRLAAANRAWASKQGGEHADLAERWLAASADERAEQLDRLRLIAHTAKGDPRKYSAKLVAAEGDYEELALALGGRCAELLELRVRAAFADLLADALAVGRDYAAAYSAAKRRVGAVDFDDLIAATVALLARPGMGEWVRFKLDQVTEHILIDEAQDTNARQWAIVHALAAEFFAGDGAPHRGPRTLFTVGDFKQAIFGFQGTDPVFFAAAEDEFARLARDARGESGDEGADWSRLSLTQSFRSTRPVLAFVDAALAVLPPPGLGAIAQIEAHASEVAGVGEVALWPPVIQGGAEAEEEGWIDDATRALAGRIAAAVKGWLADPDVRKRDGTRLEPQDVMVLVKRRGELASLLVARLHAEGVPVAGVDRLRLNAPLAVRDLLAACRFALQPEDDLSLAGLLVSPLIGWSQDDLMTRGHRERGSLWRHLQATRPAAELAPLSAMLARVDIATPCQFLEELLTGPLGGRRKLLLRLGEEALDPVEELLNAALTFETATAPSLQRFLDWFDRGDVDIVRDPSAPLDAVRVMTAHGAKGLQAPLVILADACVDPTQSPRATLRWAPGPDLDPVPVLRPRASERGGPLDAVVEASDRRELEEHWRLFYVAATRAEERLVIAGALGPRAAGEPPAQSWYRAAAEAMDRLGVPPAAEGPRVWAGGDPARRRDDRPAPATVAALPGWATGPAPVEARPPRPLAPSAIGDDAVADPPPGPAQRAAAERGRLIHALFERLPPLAPERRREAAERWLAGAGGVADAAARDEIATAVCRIVADPAHAALFGPDSLGEAPIAAVLPDGQVVQGTADRLLVTADAVRVVDFKTARRAPARLDDVPVHHLRQLAAYAAALAVVFPGRRVEAALLYTAGPTLFDLPPDLLDRHKPRLAGAEQS
jgi:ATP-dependent helicase/nuclease subunit A